MNNKLEPKELYTVEQLSELKLIPSRTKYGTFATRATLVQMIKNKKKTGFPAPFHERIGEKKIKTYRLFLGQDLIDYIERYHPDYFDKNYK